MRNAIASLIFAFVALFGATMNAQAESPTAGNIFAGIGGTTTIDRGGPIHSQARSIYSLGGGMTTFTGKRVSLIAADPPSYSAGCSGISWHFGGFAFISVDEIRQLVEAVAQASLGVAVDLAMQTLCPQCYAVMAKLREIANMMRNAAADACKIAKNTSALLRGAKFSSRADDVKNSCSEESAEEGESDSFMGGMLGSCASLSDAAEKMSGYGQDILNFMNGSVTSNGKTPAKDRIDQFGNMTYQALTALGYKDGFVKDVLLSYIGMEITFPKPGANCAEAFKDFKGTSKAQEGSDPVQADNFDSQPEGQSTAAAGSREIEVTSGDDDTPPTVDPSTWESSTVPANGAQKGVLICHAPPLLSATSTAPDGSSKSHANELARLLLCGAKPDQDKAAFLLAHPKAYGVASNSSSFMQMCGKAKEGQPAIDNDSPVYHCGPDSAKCMQPTMIKLSEAMATTSGAGGASRYTGMGWMILDALYTGVDAVANNKPLSEYPETIGVLNGAGYPLYRLINLAAVYPGTADELLGSFGASIAAQYVMDTLTKLISPGHNTAISYVESGTVQQQLLLQMRDVIMNLNRDMQSMGNDALKRMNEKRALVDIIMSINKSLQSEVISQGIAGNANLAISIKKQAQQGTTP